MNDLLKNPQQQDVENLDENILVSRIKDGSPEAFTEMVILYQKRVFKLAYGFFQNQEDAMEIVQETFIRIYNKIHQYKDNSKFQNWVFRIASNICVDYYRKFKKKKLTDPELHYHIQQQSGQAKTPEILTSTEMEIKKMENLIQMLPKRQKMVFTLKYSNHLTLKEISQVLNIALGTVKSLHHRAVSFIKNKSLTGGINP